MPTETGSLTFDEHSLDSLVEEGDRLDPAERILRFNGQTYKPTTPINAQLNPRGKEYKEQQMALYREITGHDYLDNRDEFVPNIPVDALINGHSAYGELDPGGLAKHYIAMGILVQELQLPRQARILELGSGWGFTQEFLAGCGYQTVGIEMNPDFVAASNGRLKRLGYGERVLQGSFEAFDVSKIGSFDAIVTYEAFHHAVDTEGMLRKYISCLKPEGLFALAAEPFNRFYSTWGLRLDAESVYVMRKFGWFESGWSVEYIADLMGRCGMEVRFVDKNLNELTRYMIGKLSNRRRPYQLGMWDPSIRAGWWGNWEFFSSKGSSAFLIAPPPTAEVLKIDAVNFSKAPLKASMVLPGIAELQRSFPVGKTQISLPLGPAASADDQMRLEVTSDTFNPAKLGINNDNRSLGIHIRSILWE